MGKVVGIVAIKGGVGKTTLSASIATDLANYQHQKVLFIDANYSAPNAGLHMDIVTPEKTVHDVLSGKAKFTSAVHQRYGVDVIPGSYIYHESINPLKLRDKLLAVKDDYDFIIVDSSPSLNEEVLSTMLASDYLFVVTTPDYPTLSCSLRAAKLAKQRGRPVAGIIINKIRDPAYELTLDHIEETVGIPVVARIPDDRDAVRALFTRIPLPLYNKKSPISREVHNLGRALTLQPGKKSFWREMLGIDYKREAVNRELMRDQFYTNVFGESKSEKAA